MQTSGGENSYKIPALIHCTESPFGSSKNLAAYTGDFRYKIQLQTERGR